MIAPDDRPTVLLDFDRTTFDSNRFYIDALAVLERRFGVNARQMAADYTQHCEWRNGIRFYDLLSHTEALGIAGEIAGKVISDGLAGRNYVYDDVVPFLAFVQTRASRVEIVTHGLPRFQELKRRLAPAISLLPFHPIVVPKADFIAETYPGAHGLMIDDKMVEGLPAGFRHIWIDRPAGAAGGVQDNRGLGRRGPHFKTLAEVALAWNDLF